MRDLEAAWAWWTAERAATAGVIAQAVIVLIAALVAWRQLREARRTRLEQARPQVIVRIDIPKPGGAFEIVLVNTGRTIARNVAVTFDPPLQSTFDGTFENDPGVPWRIADLSMWRDVPTLAPDQELRTTFDTPRKRFGSQLPERFTAQVCYGGVGAPRRGYSEEQVIDLGLIRQLIYTDQRDFNDLVKSTREIEKTLGRVARAIEQAEQRPDPASEVRPLSMESRRPRDGHLIERLGRLQRPRLTKPLWVRRQR